ncbi:MAG: TetR/AcrR family transcriptional regulator [Cellulosilyticaceae bacterium]
MPKTKEQCDKIKQQTKKQIVDVAIKLFAYKGFAATKIGEVAKEAGVSTGLMYHYFASKEELFRYIVEETVQMSNQGLLYFEQLPMTAAQKIMALSHMVTEDILKNEEQVARFMMMVQAGLYSGDVAINTSMFEGMNIPIEVTARIIEEAQQEGVAKEGSPLMLANLFWATVNGLCMQKLIAGEHCAMPTVEDMSAMILR